LIRNWGRQYSTRQRGTGGFLVEAFEHLKKQAKKAEDSTRLQRGSLHGIESKTLPYLLCQMNLLLHGLEYPEIDPGNIKSKARMHFRRCLKGENGEIKAPTGIGAELKTS
jgi:hypothetical protein